MHGLGTMAPTPTRSLPLNHLLPPHAYRDSGVVPKASEGWQHPFRLAAPLPRASQVQAPGSALASSGRHRDHQFQCLGLLGVAEGAGGAQLQEGNFPRATEAHFPPPHPDLPFTFPRNHSHYPRPTSSSLGASWVLHTSGGAVILDSRRATSGTVPGWRRDRKTDPYPWRRSEEEAALGFCGFSISDLPLPHANPPPTQLSECSRCQALPLHAPHP